MATLRTLLNIVQSPLLTGAGQTLPYTLQADQTASFQGLVSFAVSSNTPATFDTFFPLSILSSNSNGFFLLRHAQVLSGPGSSVILNLGTDSLTINANGFILLNKAGDISPTVATLALSSAGSSVLMELYYSST